jgi:hypothetical protein
MALSLCFQQPFFGALEGRVHQCFDALAGDGVRDARANLDGGFANVREAAACLGMTEKAFRDTEGKIRSSGSSVGSPPDQDSP